MKARRERNLGLNEECADWDSHVQTKNLTPHLGSCSLPMLRSTWGLQNTKNSPVSEILNKNLLTRGQAACFVHCCINAQKNPYMEVLCRGHSS